MLAYWIIFSFISFLSISPINIEKNIKFFFKYIFLFFLIIFIGFRHDVGGDWDIYKFDFKNNIEYFNIYELSYVRDFGFELLSYIIFKLQFDVYSLNIILAIIFIHCLNKFNILFSGNYWLAYVIAFPYLITVVSMGYSRQATAFAFILLSICEIKTKNMFKFFIFSIIALLFHKSAAILLPIIFISNFKFNFIYILILTILIFISGMLILPETTRILAGYLSEYSNYKSHGVYYRISMNILAGILFVLFYKKLNFEKNINHLIFFIFIINIILIYFIENYSTLVDRLIIYFTFIQIIIFSNLYKINPKYKILINFSVIFVYGFIYYIWFNFSYHSYAWTPYKNIIIESII